MRERLSLSGVVRRRLDGSGALTALSERGQCICVCMKMARTKQTVRLAGKAVEAARVPLVRRKQTVPLSRGGKQPRSLGGRQPRASDLFWSSLQAGGPAEEKKQRELKVPDVDEMEEMVRVGLAPDLNNPFNKGLFARKRIGAGRVFAEYKGKVVRGEELAQSSSRYLVTTDRGVTLDGDPDHGLGGKGSYANDTRGRFNYNAKLVSEGDKVYLEALTEIKPDMEVLIDYGNDYWRGAGRRRPQESVGVKRARSPEPPVARERPPEPRRPAKKAARRRQGPKMCTREDGTEVPCWKLQEEKRIRDQFGGDREAFLAKRREQKAAQRARARARRANA